MEVQSYNCELALVNLTFKRIFSNIAIERTDNGVKKRIPVQCVLGKRSRIIKNWENAEKRATMRLPMIAINRTGYARNGDRLNSLHNEVKYEMTSKYRNYNLLTPVPIDVSFDVCVMAKYPSDIDQIASNFMVFFNSDVYVQFAHPKYEGILMNNQIVMNDSVSEEHPDELDGTQDDFITSTFQFTFKTYLFGGNQKATLTPQYIVHTELSTVESSYVIQIPADQIDQFQIDHPYQAVSVLTSEMVCTEVSTYIPNPDISSNIYDGFTPIIKTIDIGFYVTPTPSDFVEYMEAVDTIYKNEIYPISGYISSHAYDNVYADYYDESTGKMEKRLSAVVPLDYQYHQTTIYDTLSPYKDRFYWRIDESSERAFPENVLFASDSKI